MYYINRFCIELGARTDMTNKKRKKSNKCQDVIYLEFISYLRRTHTNIRVKVFTISFSLSLKMDEIKSLPCQFRSRVRRTEEQSQNEFDQGWAK